MTLQLRDGYFRRHVLVQVLIFLQTITIERKGQPALGAAQRQQVDSLHAKCIEPASSVVVRGGMRGTWIDWNHTMHWLVA